MARSTSPAAAAGPEIAPVIPPRPWSKRVVGVVSAALLFHLSAQFLATWNAAPPPSDLGATLSAPFQAYIAALRLNQGYRFFAPDPGPSHLLRFRIFAADGRPVELPEFAVNAERTEGQLPPPELRVGLVSPRARLLYHRYFMLTEQLDRAIPRPLPPNVPPEEAAQQALRERAFQALTDSFSRELLRRFGGVRVELQLYEHLMPSPRELIDGKTLDHKDLERFYPVTIKYPREGIGSPSAQR